MRQVGDRHQQRRPLLLDLIELDFELTDLLRPRLVRREDRRGVFPLSFRARDLVAGRVLIALQPLELGDQPATSVLERRQLLQLGIRLKASIHEACSDGIHVLTNVRGVEHG